MTRELPLLRRKRPSLKIRPQHRIPMRTILAIVATVAASKLLVSHALFSPHRNCRGCGSACSSVSGVGFSSSVGWHGGTRSNRGGIRSETSLRASVKSTNKAGRKRKKMKMKLKKAEGSKSAETSGSDDDATAERATRKTGRSSRPGGPGRSLSEDELHRHLDSQVNYGKSSPVGPRSRNRGVTLANDERRSNSDGNEAETRDSYDMVREHQYFLRQLNNRPTLVLNANYLPLGYMPLSLWSWQDAIKAVFKGSVTVVDVYPDITVRASNIQVPLPSVIALNDYVPQRQTRPAFTRRNVFLRDKYICQYCNKRFHTADLSLDHVRPKSMGGQLTWDNTVTCCRKCNGRKGSTPPSEIGFLGMKLSKEPKCPTQMELAAISAKMIPKRVHPTWKPYLGIQERPPSGGAGGSSTASVGEKGDEEFIDDRYFDEE